jgi:hypothetical protein
MTPGPVRGGRISRQIEGDRITNGPHEIRPVTKLAGWWMESSGPHGRALQGGLFRLRPQEIRILRQDGTEQSLIIGKDRLPQLRLIVLLLPVLFFIVVQCTRRCKK